MSRGRYYHELAAERNHAARRRMADEAGRRAVNSRRVLAARTWCVEHLPDMWRDHPGLCLAAALFLRTHLDRTPTPDEVRVRVGRAAARLAA